MRLWLQNLHFEETEGFLSPEICPRNVGIFEKKARHFLVALTTHGQYAGQQKLHLIAMK